MDTLIAGGTGTANSATVDTSNRIAELTAELEKERQKYEAGAPARRIEAAQAAVDKAETQLENARTNLAATIRDEEVRSAEDVAGRAAKAEALATAEGN